MAEEIVKEQETDSPKEELDNTTHDLIKEALTEANDKSKPWYKRGLSYIIAIALVAAFYAGDKLGADVINTIVQVVQNLLGSL